MKRIILTVLAIAVWMTGCGSAVQEIAAPDVLVQSVKGKAEADVSVAAREHLVRMPGSRERKSEASAVGKKDVAEDAKCPDVEQCIETVCEGESEHDRDEGVVTRQPACTGEGRITYQCGRCGLEWSESYGEVQPHRWETISGSWWEQVILEDGTPSVAEVPWSYERCSMCGEKKEEPGGE